MRIDGSCHCGHITYTAEVDPARVAICHCSDCQTLSGTAFRTVVFVPRDRFTLLSGNPKTYVKTAESGKQRAQVFCPECGSQIYAADVTQPSYFSVRTGTARQRAELIPSSQIWCRSALPWLPTLATIKAFAEQPPLPR
jgi:hypothetical protein